MTWQDDDRKLHGLKDVVLDFDIGVKMLRGLGYFTEMQKKRKIASDAKKALAAIAEAKAAGKEVTKPFFMGFVRNEDPEGPTAA